MPRKNSIDVTVYPADEAVEEGIEFTDVQYVSLVNKDTYGIPALISEDRVKDEGLPVRILYINPENIAAFEAVRKA